MRILKYILIIVALGALGALVFFLTRKSSTPVPSLPVSNVVAPVELCFGYFSQPNERGFADKYTLRMLLDGAKASGELKFLPGEKDSKVGKFTGTVSPVDKTMMARTADLWWDTFGEGMNVKEQTKIIFGEGTASIMGGELVDRGDGVYVFKDPNSVAPVMMSLTDVACTDLVARDNVESYVNANITRLSPVKAVLGGTWHVIGVSVDLRKNSGVVVYEDGHIQEKKNFTFTLDGQQGVTAAQIP